MADEIIEEVWRIKDEIAQEHGCDVGGLAAYYLRLGRERSQREKEGAAAGPGTAAGGAAAVRWVQTEFGARQGGGSGRSGS